MLVRYRPSMFNDVGTITHTDIEEQLQGLLRNGRSSFLDDLGVKLKLRLSIVHVNDSVAQKHDIFKFFSRLSLNLNPLGQISIFTYLW